MDNTSSQDIYNDTYLNCIRECFIINEQSNKILSKQNSIKIKPKSNMDICNNSCKKNILQLFNNNDYWLKKFSSER